MRIGLINPKGTIFSKNKEMSKFLQSSISMESFRHFWSAPCLGLITIAAYLPSDWEICYVDENYVDIDFDEPYDFVCISTMTVQAIRAYEVAVEFKNRGVMTIIGGIHPTILPNEAMRYADVVISGEGESLFPKFIKDYLDGTVERLYSESKIGTFNLEDCIMPKYDLLLNYDYPIINIYTTRGCPRKCNFCCASNVYGTRYRRKTNDQILMELKAIESLFPDRMVLFADDNLFVLREQSKEMLNQMKSMNIRWIAQTDISIAEDEELLKLMYDSGCQWIVIGLESVSVKSLKGIENKNFKAKQVSSYHTKIKRINEYGIKIYGTFIVGLDEDQKEIFTRTAEFIIENRLYGANVTVPTPLPGTVLRKKLQEEHRIISNKWEDYTLWDVVMKPKQMSVSDLENGLLDIYKTISGSNAANRRLRGFLKDMRNKNG
jgi:radical SAM superfamily enzyme YgiQ (UPF0313 family)